MFSHVFFGYIKVRQWVFFFKLQKCVQCKHKKYVNLISSILIVLFKETLERLASKKNWALSSEYMWMGN